jgi:small-conductance mechanosensitive channel
LRTTDIFNERWLLDNWPQLVIPISVALLTLLVALVVRRYVFRALARWAANTSTSVDDLVVETLRTPFFLWSLMLSIHLGMQISRLPPRVTYIGGRVLLVCWIISLTLVATKISGAFIRRISAQTQGPQRVTSLTENVARLVVGLLGILILLNSLGVSVTPILTALGVGGLAVALALQDTLSNLFAGFYISLAGQMRVGDYVKLDTGEEGYITDITWRTTAIRQLSNNLILVPNAKLAQAIVTNYHLPEKRMSLLIPIGVSYSSDPVHIEKILIEEATTAAASGQISGLLADPAPFVRFIPGFGESSLDFTLICQVAEFVDQYLAQHELRKRIFARFQREGIEIPFPQRTVHFVRTDPPAPLADAGEST